MERPISFFIMLVVLLFAGISFVFAVFELKGLTFIFELGALLAFVFLLTFGMFLVYHSKSKSWGIIAAVLILLLFDVLVIFLFTRSFSMASASTVIFALAGLLVALVNAAMSMREAEVKPETDDKSKYYYQFIDKMEPEKKEDVQLPKNVQVTFTPGKFVASKKANKFHSPKCDWAQRISKENQLWFNSESEARTKGFEPDKCVE